MPPLNHEHMNRNRCIHLLSARDKVDCMGLFAKKIKQEHKVMLQHERSAGAVQSITAPPQSVPSPSAGA